MSNNQKAVAGYKKTSVTTASREKLLLMLYEAAIKFTRKAIVSCEQGDIAGRGQNIGKAYDIILELANTLNFEVGGKVALDLEQLYMFMTDQLTQANITGEVKNLNSVLKILETLNAGWIGAVDALKKSKIEKEGEK